MSFRKVQVGNLLSTTTHFDDPLVTLNNAETGTNTSDIGIIMERGSASNVALLWDESEDTFVAIVTVRVFFKRVDVLALASSSPEPPILRLAPEALILAPPRLIVEPLRCRSRHFSEEEPRS